MNTQESLFRSEPVSYRASYDAIDAYVEQQRQRLHMPGVSLAIVEGGQIVHQRGFGQTRPHGARKWGLNIVLPLKVNLWLALTLLPMLGKRRRYLLLYMPDYAWIAMICGSFALVWSFLRTGLVLGALRKSSSPKLLVHRERTNP